MGRRTSAADEVPALPRKKVGYTGSGSTYTGYIKNYKGGGEVDVVFPPGVALTSVKVDLRTKDETKPLRDKFDSSIRKNWMKKLAKDPATRAQLAAAGISEADLKAMEQDGLVPDTHRVHHKVPLEWGGSNDDTNFVLIQQDPYHKALTSAQNMKTDVTDGSTVSDWPVPNGIVFPPGAAT
jgi:hypothetical protein